MQVYPKTFNEKDYRDAVREMQTTTTSSRLWKAKMNELEETLRQHKSDLSYFFSRRANTNNFGRCWYGAIILFIQNRIKTLNHQLQRFAFYHAVSLGKPMPEQFDVEALKTIDPQVLLGKPEAETSKILVYKCPYHTENHASFTWYKHTNSGYCFGCSKHSDIIDLFQHLNNCDFQTACKELKNLI